MHELDQKANGADCPCRQNTQIPPLCCYVPPSLASPSKGCDGDADNSGSLFTSPRQCHQQDILLCFIIAVGDRGGGDFIHPTCDDREMPLLESVKSDVSVGRCQRAREPETATRCVAFLQSSVPMPAACLILI
ncbi:hypothetical protein EYF80_036860 [Liparis tanakae]|uniref:Uncharacterized protein n=1 Tax=Liparis tanakae TaxID=230148 RepID=A0A4Z2GJK5_9TELE|nr:hypothetical protein EYF80_036860 [Liparis tanakae]